MADQRTMAELLRAPTEGYAEAIMVSLILADQFELKHSLINMMTTDQFFRIRKDNPHDHIRWFNKITSTIIYNDVLNPVIKLMLFVLSRRGSPPVAKKPSRSIHTWEDLVFKFINEFFPFSRTTNLCDEISNQQRFDESFHEVWDRHKDLLRACPHHGFTELHQLDTFYNALKPVNQDSLNAAAGGNLLKRCTQDVLTIIENKYKQTSIVTTAMTAFLKQFQATLPPGSVKVIEEIYVTCGGAHPYYQCLAAGGNTFPELQDSIQGYVSAAAVNYNQGNFSYRPPEEDERAEETLTKPGLFEYTIKVPPHPVQKYKPSSQREYVVHQKDPLYPNIPYPSRMLNQKQQEKDEEKLQELANTPLNENCLAIILKKLPKKLGDPGKFLILCGFSELKCKALTDLGASINLMPLSVWKKLGNFVIVDYESDPIVPLILGRPFLRTAHALINVHGEEMILHDGDERLTLNMRMTLQATPTNLRKNPST
nr:reverse transcriptase domain-containing protein [Tanacetum cinerariifolium]